MTDTEYRPKWENRRRMIWLTWIGCVIGLGVLVWLDGDSEVREAAVYALSGTMVAIIGAYVFGAVWDDKNVLEAVSKR